ncbi:sodium/proton antiporter, CPA1 family [Nakamurella panacisegetis]|uniref:Sodium/proton antiporter, CPA1 family n=1 Tax=Nakamurella panacisegetis TaxID=1090615 RepID=A0A1H0NEK4_9ACTN|nr:Na+/H+ antiporter [Nakamurella panacisegetis]SDO90730.1 sodium/proton antiporter, CPA1 family [Nakamurella panacisegetis]
MATLLLVVALTVITVVLVGVGRRVRLPWPALMVVVSAGVAFIPAVSRIAIDPELILPLFLPPLLFATAQRTSLSLFRARWRSILGLAIALVAVTITAVAATAVALVPGITLTAAIALGAAVAPPDPVAVDAVAGPLRIPRRLVGVLQTEGLFNDATSLVVFQTALAALMTSRGGGLNGSVAWRFVYGVVAAAVIGWVTAWLVRRLTDRIQDVAGRNALTLILPFAVYLAADEARASGVIAVVVAALALGSSQQADAIEDRLTGEAFWSVVELVVTGVAFGLIGVELRSVIREAGRQLPHMLGHAALVCGVVVAVRAVWLTVALQTIARSEDPDRSPRNLREVMILTWCGMRGLATLALALALPATVFEGAVFPARTEIVVIACSVLVVTLLIPAFTLPALVKALGIADDADAEDAAERPIADRARAAVMNALQDNDLPPGTSDRVKEFVRLGTALMTARVAGDDEFDRYREVYAEVQEQRRLMVDLEGRALSAARAEVLKVRGEPGVDPDAADRVLRRLDVKSLRLG